jgi:small basic protein
VTDGRRIVGDDESAGTGPADTAPQTRARDRGALIGVAALVVGIVLGLVFQPSVPEFVEPYLPIAVVAALDAVFGGLRAYLEHIFDAKVFVVSFVFNVLVAALIVYVGDQLGVGTQLSTAIIVVLGIRIFGNAAALRRRLFGA